MMIEKELWMNRRNGDKNKKIKVPYICECHFIFKLGVKILSYKYFS